MEIANIMSIVLLIAALLMLYISFLAFRKRRLPVARSTALAMLAAAVYSFGYAFEIVGRDLESVKFWLKVEYLGIPFIATLWLIFVLQYTGREAFLKRGGYVLLFAIPVLTLILHYTNDYHHLFYKEVRYDADSMVPTVLVKGPWYWVHTFYNYSQAAAGMALFAFAFMKAVPIVRKQIAVMALGAAAPWLLNVIYVLKPFGSNLDLIPFSFVLSGLFYIWGIYRFNLLRLAPIALEQAFETMLDGVVILDFDNHVVNFNQAALRVFGELRNVKRHSGSIVPLLDQHPELLESIRREQAAESRIPIEGPDGIRHYDYKLSIVYDKGRRPIGKMLMFHEITEWLDHQEKILEGARQLERLNAFKDRLFTVVAHDIRDPLAVLISLTELLERELEAPAGDNIEAFQELRGQVVDTFQLVETLLDWFRSQRESGAFRPTLGNAASIVRQAADSARVRGELKRIRIVTDVPDDLTVYADKGMLASILRNLLSNAIKFTDAGGFVQVGARKEGDRVAFCVRDTGRGLSPEAAECLLRDADPVSGIGTEGERGLGLGLAIAKEFVRLNGGVLRADSAPDQGSTLSFSVPAMPPREGVGEAAGDGD